jgi:anti-anti-sigma factor
MEIKDKELDHGVLKVSMTGSLDVAGSDVADAHFAGLDPAKTRVIADLTHVDFLASVGIRVLVKTAKALGAIGPAGGPSGLTRLSSTS